MLCVGPAVQSPLENDFAATKEEREEEKREREREEMASSGGGCPVASAPVVERAHMFFPASSAPGSARPDAHEAPQGYGRALTLAGEPPRAKTGLLLQYAYNAALRGCRSLIFSRQRPSPEVPLPGTLLFPLGGLVLTWFCAEGEFRADVVDCHARKQPRR